VLSCSTCAPQTNMPSRYKDNVIVELERVLRALPPLRTAVDVGSGDGYYAARLMERGLIEKITPVEVLLRDKTELTPVIYDGHTLPFPDRSFELAYAIDVIHHADVPRHTLRELARVSSRYLLLKDHSYRNPLDFVLLSVLDEIGNRRFGVPSIYHYQRGFSWFPWIESEGFRLVQRVYPAQCEHGALGLLLNRLQFVSLFERVTA
jgi:SAM-dependent methyltransferase